MADNHDWIVYPLALFAAVALVMMLVVYLWRAGYEDGYEDGFADGWKAGIDYEKQREEA